MQVNETLADGLKRELTRHDPGLRARIARSRAGSTELKDRVRIKGFRPGKVPVSHLRRVYGKAAMAEIVEGAHRRDLAARRSPTAASAPPCSRRSP